MNIGHLLAVFFVPNFDERNTSVMDEKGPYFGYLFCNQLRQAEHIRNGWISAIQKIEL
jgi:hypothetical protein